MPHEAITPTYEGNPKATLSKLSHDERNVYELIVRRFLQGFYPEAIIEETKVATVISYSEKDYTFSNSGKIIVEPSWMKVLGIRDTYLPAITDRKTYPYVNSLLERKTTKPPSRFTEATLLNAMENAARYVEDSSSKTILKKSKGIGTGATRNEIIKPDYAAPGTEVTGAGIGGEFVSRTSSSAAAGIAAGASALLMEWLKEQPGVGGVNSIQIRNTIILGAGKRDFMEYPNREWGYGTLNVYQSLDRLRQL